MLRVLLRQPSALSAALAKSLSCAAVANKQIEIKDHYDFDKKVSDSYSNKNVAPFRFHL